MLYFHLKVAFECTLAGLHHTIWRYETRKVVRRHRCHLLDFHVLLPASYPSRLHRGSWLFVDASTIHCVLTWMGAVWLGCFPYPFRRLAERAQASRLVAREWVQQGTAWIVHGCDLQMKAGAAKPADGLYQKWLLYQSWLYQYVVWPACRYSWNVFHDA